MRAVFRLGPDEYVEAHLLRNRIFQPQLFSRMVVFFGAVAILFAVYLFMSGDWSGGARIGLLGGVVIMMRFRLVPALIRRNLRRDPVLNEELTVELADQGTLISSPSSRAESTWAAYVGFAETPGLFVLFRSPLVAEIIPKRALTAGDLPTVGNLLRQKLRLMTEPRR